MALACLINAGRDKICKNSLGGASKVWFMNYVENPFTVVDGEATAINPLITEVYAYEIEGDGNNFVEAMVSDRASGTTVNTQTLTLNFKKMDVETSVQMNLLAYNFPIVVVKDRNNIYHALGIDDGIDFTINANTGGAKNEMNGYVLTGVATTGALSPKLDSTTITAFLGLV